MSRKIVHIYTHHAGDDFARLRAARAQRGLYPFSASPARFPIRRSRSSPSGATWPAKFLPLVTRSVMRNARAYYLVKEIIAQLPEDSQPAVEEEFGLWFNEDGLGVIANIGEGKAERLAKIIETLKLPIRVEEVS